MPITISGSTGIAGVDGSASTPAVQGTDTNTGIAFPAADTVAVGTGGTERMRVDSSGNVGIGTSSPAERLQVSNGNLGLLGATGTEFTGFFTQNNGASASAYRGLYYDGRNENGVAVANMLINVETDGSSGWSWSSTPSGSRTTDRRVDRMRIDSNGNFLVGGTTSTLFASSHAFVNSGTAVLGLRNSGSTAGKYWQVGPDSNSSFKVYNQSSVGMFMSDGSTSWSSSSDERQKNIIEPISNAVAKVASLRAVIGSYKADEENKRRSFLIAQDVEQALPEAVTTAPDGFLGVAYTDVIPLLVAAIQELKAENDDLKARLTALEAK
jgi:hypothetical protein